MEMKNREILDLVCQGFNLENIAGLAEVVISSENINSLNEGCEPVTRETHKVQTELHFIRRLFVIFEYEMQLARPDDVHACKGWLRFPCGYESGFSILEVSDGIVGDKHKRKSQISTHTVGTALEKAEQFFPRNPITGVMLTHYSVRSQRYSATMYRFETHEETLRRHDKEPIHPSDKWGNDQGAFEDAVESGFRLPCGEWDEFTKLSRLQYRKNMELIRRKRECLKLCSEIEGGFWTPYTDIEKECKTDWDTVQNMIRRAPALEILHHTFLKNLKEYKYAASEMEATHIRRELQTHFEEMAKHLSNTAESE